MTWPEFLIIGGHKCATTSLHSVLSEHPDIAMSRVKEPHYFARGALQERLHTGVWRTQEYMNLWDHDGSGLRTGESSALYLYFADEVVAAVNREMLHASPKVIVCVRNPVERAFSSYCDVRLKNPFETARSFEAAVLRELAGGGGGMDIGSKGPPTIHHLALGFYARYIKRYQESFGSDRVLIVVFDDLTTDLEAVVNRICDFLGVPGGLIDLAGGRKNVGGLQWDGLAISRLMSVRAAVMARRSLRRVSEPLHTRVVGAALQRLAVPTPVMSLEIRKRLNDLYQAEVTALSKLMGCDLSHWLSDR